MTESDISLRLDTRLYSYDEMEDEIRLKERYAVMGTPVTNIFGTWIREKGLAITESNIWERRIDLGGNSIIKSTKIFSFSFALKNGLRFNFDFVSSETGSFFSILSVYIESQKL